MGEVFFRPMRPGDVEAAERLSSHAFHELDLARADPGAPPPQPRTGERSEQWIHRTHHLVTHDAGGCWVAELDGRLVGFATSLLREKCWCLATYAVAPDLQGQGIGKPLLEVALNYGRGSLRGMLAASDDPRAYRRYRASGFTMHPQMTLSGSFDPTEMPDVSKVRDGSAGDIDLMDSVDRQTRGSAHGVDHPMMQSRWRFLVSDTTTGSGYAYVQDKRVTLLAATNRRTATRLLWAALAECATADSGRVEVPHVTIANEWAIDVGLAARLSVRTEGYLGLRGMKPPTPYLHNGSLL